MFVLCFLFGRTCFGIVGRLESVNSHVQIHTNVGSRRLLPFALRAAEVKVNIGR